MAIVRVKIAILIEILTLAAVEFGGARLTNEMHCFNSEVGT